MTRLLLVCLGGALGTGLRYLASWALSLWLGPAFPFGTLVVNVVGSFVTGVVQEVGVSSLLISDTTRLFLTIGMMGGLTTYSSFSYDTVRLMQGHAWRLAWLNLILTSALCLTVCVLGIAVGRWLVASRSVA